MFFFIEKVNILIIYVLLGVYSIVLHSFNNYVKCYLNGSHTTSALYSIGTAIKIIRIWIKFWKKNSMISLKSKCFDSLDKYSEMSLKRPNWERFGAKCQFLENNSTWFYRLNRSTFLYMLYMHNFANKVVDFDLNHLTVFPSKLVTSINSFYKALAPSTGFWPRNLEKSSLLVLVQFLAYDRSDSSYAVS